MAVEPSLRDMSGVYVSLLRLVQAVLLVTFCFGLLGEDLRTARRW